ncbi:MAG: DUF6259 domain-containing protein [Planctomycetota bacterium]
MTTQMIRCRPLWIVFLLSSSLLAAEVEVREDDQAITMENPFLRIVASKAAKGAIASLTAKLPDGRTSPDFIAAAADAPALYRLTAVGENRARVNLASKDAQEILYAVSQKPGEAVLTITARKHLEHDIAVVVTITMQADSPLTRWRMEVANRTTMPVESLACPCLSAPRQLGESSADDELALPMCDGLLCRDLAQQGIWGNMTCNYPGGGSMQFMAFYDPTAGLYLAACDSEGYPKRLGRELRKQQVDLLITHVFPESPGGTVRTEYDTVVGVFHGDPASGGTTWHDAADIYKAWAIRQPWCAKRTVERDDIPSWFKAAPPLLDYSIPRGERLAEVIPVEEIPATLASYAKALGRGVVGRPQGWEKPGAWVGPDCFPPFGGDAFARSVRQMRKDGNRLFLYLEGYQWMLNDPRLNYDGNAFFEEHCGADAVMGEDGKVWKGVHSGRTYADGCSATRSAREMLVENAMRCVAVGADAVQIEVVGGGGRPCYSTAHGHPPGNGRWFSQNFAAVLDTVRSEGRKKNPDLVVTIEEPGEMYIAHLDGYNGRNYRQTDWPRGGPGTIGVPLFTYVYHEYALAFSGWHFMAFGKNWLQMRDIAANFICGTMDGVNVSIRKDSARAESANPETLALYRNVTTAMATFANEYVVLGRMLRPTAVTCEPFTFEYGVKVKDKWEKRQWTEPSVMHSVWRTGVPSQAGKIGYVLLNLTDNPAHFEMELRRYDLPGQEFKAAVITAQMRKPLLEREALPKKVPLELGSREATLIEVEAAR